MSHRFAFLSAALLAVALVAPGARAGRAPTSEPAVDRFVFFAVLEELYDLGLPDEVVDRIVANGESGPVSFVYACGICMPAYDAFVTYRGRPVFYGKKGEPRDFGSEATAELRAELAQEDPARRTAAIGRLIQAAIARRVEDMRWTEEEKAAWQDAIAKARKQGESLLRSAQAQGKGRYSFMKTCAMCNGAWDGAGGK